MIIETTSLIIFTVGIVCGSLITIFSLHGKDLVKFVKKVVKKWGKNK